MLVPGGLTYVLLVMFIFIYLFLHMISELPVPIAVKLCHMIGIWVCFVILVQKFGALPNKFGS